MKRIRFLEHFYAVDASGNSNVKYRAGSDYPVTEETTRLAASGIAEEVEAPDATVAVVDAPADVVPAA